MKKILALLLALMMLASLVACSTKQGTPAPADTQEPAQSENAGTETPEQPAQPETPAEIPTVTMLTFTDWYKSGWEALTAYIDEHAEELGFRLKIDIIAGGGEGEELVRAKFATRLSCSGEATYTGMPSPQRFSMTSNMPLMPSIHHTSTSREIGSRPAARARSITLGDSAMNNPLLGSSLLRSWISVRFT